MRYFEGLLAAIVFCFLLFFSFFCNSQDLSLSRIDGKDGLPHNSITSLEEDKDGFLWIGTENGLSRFDGYSYRNYFHDIGNANSISDNYVHSLFNSSDNVLWVGTMKGLNFFNSEKNHFQRVDLDMQVNILKIIEIETGKLIAASNEGIFLIEKVMVDGQVQHIATIIKNDINNIINDVEMKGDEVYMATGSGILGIGISKLKSAKDVISPKSICLRDNLVTVLFSDIAGQGWIGTNEGLFYKNLNEFTKSKEVFNNTEIRSLYKDRNGSLWVGSRGNGLHRVSLDALGNVVGRETFLIDKENENSLSNEVFAIYEDKWENLWIGTKNGLFKKNQSLTRQFFNVKGDVNGGNALSHNVISAIYKDTKGNVWLGTSSGINKLVSPIHNEELDSVKKFIDLSGFNHIRTNKVQAIEEDHNGFLWIGTKDGVALFDPEKEQYIKQSAVKKRLEKLDQFFVRAIHRDKADRMWVGSSGQGLAVYDFDKDTFLLLQDQPEWESLIGVDVWAIEEDSAGDIYVGTRKNGLYKITIPSEKFEKPIIENIVMNKGAEQDWVTSMYCDINGILWVGTDKGLKKLDGEGKVINVSLPYYNSGSYIAGIQQDKDGHLWIATLQGIFRYEITGQDFHFYEQYNGDFARVNYNFGIEKGNNGKIYMGGINGLTYFKVDEIKLDTAKYPVFFTDFQILNQSVSVNEKVNENIHLQKDINETKHIKFSYEDYQFSFEFSSLYFTDPGKIKYSYMLEGFDKDWVYTDYKRRYVSYSNLPSGKYVFKVRSTNPNGKWLNNEKSIALQVLPPPWQTWWAMLLYLLTLLLVFTAIKYFYFVKAKYKHEIKMERLAKEKTEELNQWKLKFFTNISHEFKTPLTLIYGPLQNLILKKDSYSREDSHKMLKLMDKSVKRLLGLINQLMEFRKIEQGKIKLKVEEYHLNSFLNEVFNSFKELAERQNIHFKLASCEPELKVWFDKEKLEMVMYNLLSNAFKFTPEQGGINMSYSVDKLEKRVWIAVEDSGVGISNLHHTQVFERFYQVENEKDKFWGTGIGLALTKSLIELHHGEIILSSEPGRGSCFKFYLPMVDLLAYEKNITGEGLKKKRLSPKEVLLKESHFSDEHTPELVKTKSEDIEKDNIPHILIVEDDADLRLFIKELLMENFNVTEAQEGGSGLELALETKPDLIISDIMMREMDGLALCKSLKTNIVTSHIPVILLTAKTAEEDKLVGYETGADAYITKPFNVELLTVRVHQLIASRRAIKDRFRKEILLNPKEISVTSTDEKFIKEIMDIVENHISDESFKIEDFAKKLGVSRSVLYRKLQDITNQAPVEFIRTIRMKRAAQLLQTGNFSVSEVSYRIGFSNARYFSTCFRKEFGSTPSQFAEQAAQ